MAFAESTIMLGKDCKLFINEYEVSGFTNSFSADDTIKVLACDTWGPAEQVKPGQRSLSIDFAGIYEYGVLVTGMRAAVDACFTAGLPLETVRIIFVSGLTTVGAVAMHAMGFVTSRGKRAVATELVRVAAKLKPSNVFDLNANILHLGAETASGTGTNVNVGVDRIGAVGGLAHISVYAWSGLTSLVAVVQGSADGSTNWQTLCTFTTATGLTSERKTLATVVHQYRRVIWTIVGTGSCSFVVTAGELPAAA